MENKEVEVRGSLGKYNDASLKLLSELWNKQEKTEEEDWKKIINENKDKLLEDESE